MDPVSNDGANTAPATGTTAPETATSSTTAPAASATEEANPSKQDWTQLKKDQRALVDKISALVEAVKPPGRTAEAPKPANTSAPTPAPADANADRIANLERKAELGGVYADLGIKAGPQRDFIDVATKGMAPEAIRPFVEAYMKTLPAPTTAAQTPAAASPKPVVAPVATGAPAVTGNPPDSGDLGSIDPAVFNSLPREERLKRVNEYRSRGPNSNPYAGARVRELTRGGRK